MKRRGRHEVKIDTETGINDLMIYGGQLTKKLSMGNLRINVKGEGAKDEFRSQKSRVEL